MFHNRFLLINTIILLLMATSVYADSGSVSDPTQPTGPVYETDDNPASNAADLQLNAIMSAFSAHTDLFSKPHIIAIINGQLGSLNDQIDGYKIIRIDQQSVTLESADQKILVLALASLDIKKPSTGKAS